MFLYFVASGPGHYLCYGTVYMIKMKNHKFLTVEHHIWLVMDFRTPSDQTW